MLGFMLKSVGGKKYMNMVALCEVSNLNDQILHQEYLKVVKAIDSVGFDLGAISVDNHTTNQKFFKEELCHGLLTFSIPHPSQYLDQVFLLYDRVHIFKNLYNNFVNKAYFQRSTASLDDNMRGSLLIFLVLASASASYIPPYIEGEPLTMEVTSLDPPDIRELPLYRIDITVQDSDGQIVDGIIHRSYPEFEKLDEKLNKSLLSDGLELILPTEALATLENLNDYVQIVAGNAEMMGSHLVQDFMGINWSGSNLTFMNDMIGFLDMILLERMPEFMPEPPVIDEADFLAPETPFEVYVNFLAYRHNKLYTKEYLDFLERYSEVTPAFDGPLDGSDVMFPGATPIDTPYYYNRTAVHFLPGGYLNGHNVRVSYLGKTKFSFLNESRIQEWVAKLHEGKSPKRILDMGTGGCFSAFALAEMFPEAEVIGVDLSAPFVRFCRKWLEVRQTPNVQFYYANGESLDFLVDESFDFINFAYVLHEMPGPNAQMIMDEMFRLLSPGGTLNGFEVPYFANPTMAEIYALINTWGFQWDEDGPHGPEPYIHEYEFNTQLPVYLNELGFLDVEIIPYTFFESIFLATKPMSVRQ
eukprot:maker-scaffold427_size174323-snap-gene-0.44 protein:Tk04512 transcript:maker-scaffold427_size174323-snap-gene-0.44-mRNA-1 annotation:"hypothetical protein BRAFLDRAFT_126511"